MIDEGRGRPLAGAGEGDRVEDAPLGGGVGAGHRLEGGIRRLLRGTERRECTRHVSVGVEHLDIGDGHARLGQRAGLVDAHRVDAREHLDGGKVLHQHLALREAHHRDGHRDAREEHQPLGDHRHDTGDRAADRLVHGLVGAQLRDEEQDPDGRDHVRRDADEAVDVIAELGARLGELLGLCGEARGEGVSTHARGDVETRSRNDEGPGHHGVSGRLVDRVRLAGEEALVDLQALGLDDLPVDDELVARPEDDEIVEDDLHGPHVHVLAVAAHHRPGLADDRQLRQGSACPVLLDDADQGVGHDDEPEEGVLEGRHEPHDDPQRADEGVEPREGVGADDAREAAAAGIRCVVGLTARHALGDLLGGESGERDGLRHDSSPSMRRRITPSRSAHGPISSSEMPRRSMADSATIAPARS